MREWKVEWEEEKSQWQQEIEEHKFKQLEVQEKNLGQSEKSQENFSKNEEKMDNEICEEKNSDHESNKPVSENKEVSMESPSIVHSKTKSYSKSQREEGRDIEDEDSQMLNELLSRIQKFVTID